MRREITRRRFVAGTAATATAIATVNILTRRAEAAEFTYKYANNSPLTHPMTIRMTEAANKIKEESNGRLEIQIFPNNQLGGDTDMLSQVRSGAIDFFTLSGLILATLVPVASINGIGFAWKSYDQIWPAMDGELGAHVRGAIAKSGLVAFDKMWDNGYRQITSSTKPINSADDLKGFKIRVPPSPLWTSMFKAFGASPVSIPWAETYSAMQTKIADGLEQPLIGLLVDKMYEVQKYCSETNHMFDGFWVLANKRVWGSIPEKLREVIELNINEEAIAQRKEVEHMNANLADDLKSKGLEFFKVKNEDFRAKLVSTGFYTEWQKRFGDEAWALLESTTGKLG